MNFIISPLEQFQIISLIPINILDVNISFTNASFFMVLATILIITFFNNSIKNATIVPRRQQAFTESMYEFIYNLVYENIGKKGNLYFPFIFVLFTFILVLNLLGMIPYSFTVTSHIIVTFFLALSFNLGFIFLGFLVTRYFFFNVICT